MSLDPPKLMVIYRQIAALPDIRLCSACRLLPTEEPFQKCTFHRSIDRLRKVDFKKEHPGDKFSHVLPPEYYTAHEAFKQTAEGSERLRRYQEEIDRRVDQLRDQAAPPAPIEPTEEQKAKGYLFRPKSGQEKTRSSKNVTLGRKAGADRNRKASASNFRQGKRTGRRKGHRGGKYVQREEYLKDDYRKLFFELPAKVEKNFTDMYIYYLGCSIVHEMKVVTDDEGLSQPLHTAFGEVRKNTRRLLRDMYGREATRDEFYAHPKVLVLTWEPCYTDVEGATSDGVSIVTQFKDGFRLLNPGGNPVVAELFASRETKTMTVAA